MIAVVLLLDNCHFDVFNAALFTALSLKQNVCIKLCIVCCASFIFISSKKERNRENSAAETFKEWKKYPRWFDGDWVTHIHIRAGLFNWSIGSLEGQWACHSIFIKRSNWLILERLSPTSYTHSRGCMEGEYGIDPLYSFFLSLSLPVSHSHNTHTNPCSHCSHSVRLYTERQWSFIYEFVQTIACECVCGCVCVWIWGFGGKVNVQEAFTHLIKPF